MTRITQPQLARMSLEGLFDSREKFNKYSNEVSSGLKVSNPGDSRFSGTINSYRDLLDRIEGHTSRIEAAKAVLAFQDNTVAQLNDLLVRAKEIAAQNANETVGTEIRSQAANEIWEIRDHIFQLANQKYQGRFIFGGLDDDDQPFNDDVSTNYTGPATGSAARRFVYDPTSGVGAEPGNALSRTINLTDDFTMTIASPGNTLFQGTLTALERLGRAMSGFSTDTTLNSGVAYNLPTDLQLQTRDIKDAMDALDVERQTNVMPERISLGAKLKRIETAESLLSLSRDDAKSVLDELQNADIDISATRLAEAETGLNASYAVSAKVLQLSILNFL